MISEIIWILAPILAAVFLLKKLLLSQDQTSNLKVPPKVPWALPLLGHMLYMGDFPCKTMLKWKQKYGPIFEIQFGSFRTVVLHDAKLGKEAFKQAAISDRPPIVTFLEGTRQKGVVFVDYFHGEQRQFLMKSLKRFNDADSSSMEALVQDEVSELLEQISSQQGQAFQIHHAFAAVFLNSVWGCIMGDRFRPEDPSLAELNSIMNRITQIPGVFAQIGMFVPWFSRLLPGLTGVTTFVNAYKELRQFISVRIDEKGEFRGDEAANVVEAYMDCVKNTTDPNSTFHVKNNFMTAAIADLLLGAGETMATFFEWTILLLARFPEVQAKLQGEISRVVTDSRFPSSSDRVNMPYTEALLEEILRFTSFVPMGGVPHYSNVDTEVCGYFIPKNTVFFLNTWGIQRDPEIWGDPEEFRPERFLDASGKFVHDGNVTIFSLGRRACLGEFIARNRIFLVTTRIFQRFNVRYASKIPSTSGTFAFSIFPEPFEVVFSERM